MACQSSRWERAASWVSLGVPPGNQGQALWRVDLGGLLIHSWPLSAGKPQGASARCAAPPTRPRLGALVTGWPTGTRRRRSWVTGRPSRTRLRLVCQHGPTERQRQERGGEEGHETWHALLLLAAWPLPNSPHCSRVTTSGAILAQQGHKVQKKLFVTIVECKYLASKVLPRGKTQSGSNPDVALRHCLRRGEGT